MKQTNYSRQGFIMVLALCALAVGIVVFVAAVPRAEMKSADAPQAAPPVSRVQTSVYGMHTLARSQSLRLSVVNAGFGVSSESIASGESTPANPIHLRRVMLAFDVYAADAPDPSHPSAADGSVRNLRLLRRESHTFMLQPGQGATLEIGATRANETVGAWVLADPPDPNTPGETAPPEPIRSAVVTSLEVRQGNSTVLVLPGTTRGFNPQPDPPRDR